MQSENINDRTRTVGLRTSADDLHLKWDAQTAVIAKINQFLTPLLEAEVKDNFINLRDFL